MTEISFTRTIKVDGQGMAAHAAQPGGSDRVPAVVVIQHAPGVDTFIQAMVERLSRAGYAAMAPDLYYRQEQVRLDPLERMKRLKDTEIIADVNATVQYLQREPNVDPQRIGVMGFCMGGRIAYLAAATNAGLKASVVYYGGNIMAPWGEGVPAPFARTGDIGCPLLFHFGDDDTNPSPEDRRKIDAELTRCGKAHEFYTYRDAGHAFMNFTNVERYRAAASDVSWPRTLDFLARHLKR